jgi:predicted amidohydrolase
MIKLAGVQMQVEAGNKVRNLAHAQELIAEAARQGADLIVLPEVMDLGWTNPSARQDASAIPSGDTCTMLSAAAQQYGVYLCAGLVERAPDGAIYNAAVILDRQGRVILHHRKLNELDIAHDLYTQGDRLGVCHTDLGTLGLLICADAFAQDQVISRTLGYMGADLIVSPSSWAVPPGHDNTITPYGDEWRAAYGPVARDFALWFVGVSNVGPIPAGPWAGWRCIGCSLVVGPDGQQVAQGPYGEETILYVVIDPVARPARGTEWAARWYDQQRS